MRPTGLSWLPDACPMLESSQQHECSQATSILSAICCRHFQAVDARTLRAAVGTFCDLLALATRSIEMFGSTRKQ